MLRHKKNCRVVCIYPTYSKKANKNSHPGIAQIAVWFYYSDMYIFEIQYFNIFEFLLRPEYIVISIIVGFCYPSVPKKF